MDQGSTSGNVGWHADPSDPSTTRYWDGTRWTAERRWDGAAWVDVPLDAGPGATDPTLQRTPEPTPLPQPESFMTPPSSSAFGAAGVGGPQFGSGSSGSSGSSGLGSLDQRTKLILGGIVAAIVVVVAVVAFRGDDDGGSKGSLRADLIEEFTSEDGGDLTEEEAGCMADHLIDAGFDRDDYDTAKESEDGVGVSSRIVDMLFDAGIACATLPGG